MRIWAACAILVLSGCAHSPSEGPLLHADLCQVTENRRSSPKGRLIRIRTLIESSEHATRAFDPQCGRGLLVFAPSDIGSTDAFNEMWRAGMAFEGGVLVELTGYFTWRRKERSPRLTLTEKPVVLHPDKELEED